MRTYYIFPILNKEEKPQTMGKGFIFLPKSEDVLYGRPLGYIINVLAITLNLKPSHQVTNTTQRVEKKGLRLVPSRCIIDALTRASNLPTN